MTLNATHPVPLLGDLTWTPVCALSDILPNSGVCALVGGKQVAVFRVCAPDAGEERVYAISNYDPYARAFVMSRGLVGSSKDLVKVASPLLKHTFDLATGQSLDHPGVKLPTYEVKVLEGRVWLRVPTNGCPPERADHAEQS